MSLNDPPKCSCSNGSCGSCSNCGNKVSSPEIFQFGTPEESNCTAASDNFPNGCPTDKDYTFSSRDLLIMPADGETATLRVCECRWAVNQCIQVVGNVMARFKILDAVTSECDGCLLTIESDGWEQNPAEGVQIGSNMSVWAVDCTNDIGLCTRTMNAVEDGSILVTEKKDPCNCDDDPLFCVSTYNPQDPAGTDPTNNPACGFLLMKDGCPVVLKKGDGVDAAANITHIVGYRSDECDPINITGTPDECGILYWDGDKYTELKIPRDDQGDIIGNACDYKFRLSASGCPELAICGPEIAYNPTDGVADPGTLPDNNNSGWLEVPCGYHNMLICGYPDSAQSPGGRMDVMLADDDQGTNASFPLSLSMGVGIGSLDSDCSVFPTLGRRFVHVEAFSARIRSVTFTC